MISLIKENLKEKNNYLYYYTQMTFMNTQNIVDDELSLDYLIERKNQYELLDYIIDNEDAILNEELLIFMNKKLREGTIDASNPRYNIGGYKIVDNTIGIINNIYTSKVEDVKKDMDALLNWYNNIETITLEDIIEFHHNFELIHPFSDANGRVGRLIMFKECLRNNICPFIILKEDKLAYLNALRNYKNNNQELIDVILESQKKYMEVSRKLMNNTRRLKRSF